MSHIPRFFKVVLLPKSSEQLLIPLAFVTHMKGDLPNQVLLRNYHGKVWLVTVAKVGNKFLFEDGWAKFVEDNQVENGDFLVFHYDGNYIFDTKLYGNNACEKEITQSSCCEAKEEEGMEMEMENVRENNYDGEADEVKDNYTGEENDEESEDIFAASGDDEEYAASEDDEEFMWEELDDPYDEGEEFEDENEEELEKENLRKQKSKGKSEKSGNGKDSAEAEGKFGDTGEEEDEVFKYGVISRPENPYFVTKLREKRTNHLYVPVDVIRDHNLKLPEKLILHDEKKREWNSRVKVWKDGRTWIEKGWKAFRKWNNLKWEDRCLCEFVQGRDRTDFFLKITILRAGSWLPKEGK